MLSTESRALTGMLLANKYRLDKRLGAGGMGEVYRAVNVSIGRPVAIKILRPELLRNEDVVQRFLREARAATLVRHPNVVDVLDVLEHQDIPFMVQELLSGEDLADYVDSQQGKLPLDEVLAIMLPVAEAVGAAHAKGVVHRDLKPANVFLHTVDETVIPKVLDFGISKITTGDSSRVTTTGTALGTPAYMSPEQIEGLAHVDARSDVWSLGVMLFELAAGTRPFVAETPGALFVKIATTAPRPLGEVCPSCPEAFAAIVTRCLRASKADRYDDARALATALRQLADARGVPIKERLLSIRPRVSLLTDGETSRVPESLEPTMDESSLADGIKATRAADPDTQAAIERVARAMDPSPVSARTKTQPVARRRWIAVGIAATVATTVVVAATARSRSPGETPHSTHTTSSRTTATPDDAAVTSESHDASALEAISAADAAVVALTEASDAAAAIPAPDAESAAHNGRGAPRVVVRRNERADAGARSTGANSGAATNTGASGTATNGTQGAATSENNATHPHGATTYE